MNKFLYDIQNLIFRTNWIPVIVIIISAFLTYFLNNKKSMKDKKNEALQKQYDIYCSLYRKYCCPDIDWTKETSLKCSKYIYEQIQKNHDYVHPTLEIIHNKLYDSLINNKYYYGYLDKLLNHIEHEYDKLRKKLGLPSLGFIDRIKSFDFDEVLIVIGINYFKMLAVASILFYIAYKFVLIQEIFVKAAVFSISLNIGFSLVLVGIGVLVKIYKLIAHGINIILYGKD